GDPNRRPDLAAKVAAHGSHVRTRRVGVKLDDVQSRFGSGFPHFLWIVGAEYAYPFHSAPGCIENLTSGLGIHATRAVGEDDSDVTGADLGGEGGIHRASHAAELNLCEHHAPA